MIKGADCQEGNDRDLHIEGEERKGKRKRQQPQKYKDDVWLKEFNENCGEEDSFDDKTWSPEKKKSKVYGGSGSSDEEDEETPQKKKKKCSHKLPEGMPTGSKPLSPVVQRMLEKLAISKADVTKKKQALNKLGASLAIHRWARKNNFPLLQQQLLSTHFRDILSDYGRLGAGVVSTTEITLKKCWQLHYCCEDTKLHKICFLCNEETWGDFPKDDNISLEPLIDFENVLEVGSLEVDVNQSVGEDHGAPPAILPSSLSENLEDNDQR